MVTPATNSSLCNSTFRSGCERPDETGGREESASEVTGSDLGGTISSETRGMGSATGAGGAIDVIAAVCAMNESKVPAAVNCETKADGCNLNIAGESRDVKIRYALSCSYTYGGQTAAVVLKNSKC